MSSDHETTTQLTNHQHVTKLPEHTTSVIPASYTIKVEHTVDNTTTTTRLDAPTAKEVLEMYMLWRGIENCESREDIEECKNSMGRG